MSDRNKDQYILSSLTNALDLLSELATVPNMGVTELSQKLGLGKSSVFRMLYTLEQKGFVQKVEDSRYSLGIKAAIIGRAADNQLNNFKVIHYIVEELAKKTSVAAYLCILATDCSMIFADSAFGDSPLQFRASVGTHYPAYCSGSGKMLLSYLLGSEQEEKLYGINLFPFTPTTITNVQRLKTELAEIRERGWSMDDGEGEANLICYGMPVLSKDGRCICALSVSGLQQIMIDRREEFFEALKDGVKSLEIYSELVEEYVGMYNGLKL